MDDFEVLLLARQEPLKHTARIKHVVLRKRRSGDFHVLLVNVQGVVYERVERLCGCSPAFVRLYGLDDDEEARAWYRERRIDGYTTKAEQVRVTGAECDEHSASRTIPAS